MRRLLAYLRSGRGISGFAAFALGWMLLVILEGAVVRATGSGAGCGKHWPLCNGEFIPRHPRVATMIEFAHRSVTAVCSGLVFALAGWSFLAHPRGHRARKAAIWSVVLLLTEALLGAVLVLGGYVEHNTSDARVLVQSVHFTNTLLLLAALTLTWWWQRPRTPILQQAKPALRQITWVALTCTILTGATGSVAALADTLFPAANLRSALLADLSPTAPLLIRMRWMHPAASIATVLAVGALALTLRRPRKRLLLLLLASQLAMGAADVLALAPISLQLLHLLGADLLWVALVATAAQVMDAVPAHSRAPGVRLADAFSAKRI